MAEFPELNSFGTLLSFAVALEEVLGELARRAAERDDCTAFRDELVACARKHDKRSKQLERLKRETPIWKRESYADGSSAWREEEPLVNPAAVSGP